MFFLEIGFQITQNFQTHLTIFFIKAAVSHNEMITIKIKTRNAIREYELKDIRNTL